MDKVRKYQKIVKELVSEYKEYLAKAKVGHYDTTIKSLVDVTNNHFQLLIAGWKDNRYSFIPLFHIDIIEEKIWLQQNNTEFQIVEELMDKGVEKEDIVLGFLNERDRAYSGFAVS